ncbi:AraR_C domain-containing protein [Azospirillaceae bacterium]
MVSEPGATVVGLTAVIVAVTEEVPRVLVVRRMTHRLAPPLDSILDSDVVARATPADALPFGPFDAARHRTLESGLRNWVEEQTGLPLRYVEQLYTFGDRYRDPRELAGGARVVSVGYIALVREAPLSGSGEAEWRNWYDYFPWEDWRNGQPAVIDQAIRPALICWAESVQNRPLSRARQERVMLAFGGDANPWDSERALERYELLYEAGLVSEAVRDRRILSSLETTSSDSISEAARRVGTPMALDNRRILAVALGRLRGKLTYRPLVFDLLPPNFTLYQLQRLVEALSGGRLHKQNFRRLVVGGGLVEPTGQVENRTGGRPAELFRFRREVLRERATLGIGLPIMRNAH